jgi:hypothetical protein
MRYTKKVESFSRLVAFCTGYEGKYNPGQPNLRIDALVAYIENAKQAMGRVTSAKSAFDTAVNSRKDEFESLVKLAPNILLALKNSDAAKEDLNDVRGFVRQLAGYSPKDRKPVSAAEDAETKKRRSSLQLAYTSKVDWFDKLVQALENQPQYTSSVEALTKPGLKAKANQLKDLNSNVLSLYAGWSNARVERDKILFHNADSLYHVMAKVKNEVRMIFGSGSPEYTQIKSLSFTKSYSA